MLIGICLPPFSDVGDITDIWEWRFYVTRNPKVRFKIAFVIMHLLIYLAGKR